MASKTNADYHIEKFWLGLKTAMFNFYKVKKHSCLKRDVDTWSSILNTLQLEKNYSMIERQIRDYMICYGLDVMRGGDTYHLGILNTNIKRWDKLTSHYGLLNQNRNTLLSDGDGERPINIARSLFQCCLEICFVLSKANIHFDSTMNDIELIVIQQNIYPLIKIAKQYRKIAVLDCLIRHVKTLFIYELICLYGDSCLDSIDIPSMKGKTIANIVFDN